jgi:hypothetical protein
VTNAFGIGDEPAVAMLKAVHITQSVCDPKPPLDPPRLRLLNASPRLYIIAFDYDPGFDSRVAMAKHFNVSIRELSRILVAVKENWNSLSYLLIIALRQPFYGFFGGVAGQARIDQGAGSKLKMGEARGSGGLAGNASQFYISGLTPHHATLIESRSLL